MCKIPCSNFFVLLLLLASSTWADDPVQIEASTSTAVAGSHGCSSTSRPAGAGPFGCYSKSSSPQWNVRLHSLKTSSGVTFFRKTLTADQFFCFEVSGSRNLTAKNIKECAEATVAAGLQMYRWVDTACTGYSKGIPKNMICRTKESVVLYSVDAVLQESTTIPLSLHQSVSSVWADWSRCHPSFISKVTKFQLTWNGATITLNGTTFGHRLKDSALCTNNLSLVNPDLKAVTLAAFDASDRPLMGSVTVTLKATPEEGRRRALQNGNCIYYDNQYGVSYNALEGFCRDTLYGTMFIANNLQDVGDYLNQLSLLEGVQILINPHPVGLSLVAGAWRWQSGLSQIADGINVTDQNDGGECAKTWKRGSDHILVLGESCSSPALSTVCHEYMP